MKSLIVLLFQRLPLIPLQMNLAATGLAGGRELRERRLSTGRNLINFFSVLQFNERRINGAAKTTIHS